MMRAFAGTTRESVLQNLTVAQPFRAAGRPLEA